MMTARRRAAHSSSAAPALGREDDAGRELVRRRDQHRADVEAVQPLDAQAAAVHGHGPDAQAHGLDVRALAAVSGILHGHAAHAARPQRLADQAQALRVATAQHHAVRVCDRASGAIEVGRQRRARAQRTVGIRVARARRSVAASSTRRSDDSQARRGKSETSGKPGRKS